ncbi:hypothetical protein P692DRAFT_201807508 [Suillus brevipes Sb2]|nr:hypothetical protein P692DRAFT_201807508 [Suillus brevipes Sb2]
MVCKTLILPLHNAIAVLLHPLGDCIRQRPGPSSTSPRRIPPIVEVPCIDDKKALYVARRPETASEMAKRIKNPKWWRPPIRIQIAYAADHGHNAGGEKHGFEKVSYRFSRIFHFQLIGRVRFSQNRKANASFGGKKERAASGVD